MRKVDFFQLPRHVQERFIATTTGIGVPSVLLLAKPARRLPRTWTALGAAGLALVIAFTLVGYGSLGHAHALLEVSYLAVFAAGFFAAVLAFLRALAWATAPQRLPYPVGVYLYPVGVVDATASSPRVHPLTDLKAVTGSEPARALTLHFAGGKSFEFDAQTPAQASAIEQQIRHFQQELAAAKGDPRELAALDPLTDSGVPTPLMPTDPLVRTSPGWVRFSLLIALVSGALLGAGVWYLRNTMSERSMLAAAVKQNSVEGYRGYLTAGGQRAEVSELWLPRAELQRARAQGTVEAVEQFAARHSSKKLANEVTAALRAALLEKLARAQKSGELKPLRMIATQHARHDLIADELAAAIRGAYQQALDRFVARSAKDAPAVHLFMQRLVRYAEQHGPTVQVRFLPRLDRSVELLDGRIRRGPFRNPEFLPAQFFDAKRLVLRHDELGERLVARLQKEFSPEILRFERGKDLPLDAKPTKVDVPTLTVVYATAFTGAVTVRKKRGVCVPILVTYRPLFEIPNSGEPLEMKFSAASRPDIEAVVDEGLSADALYRDMADKCHARFEEEFVGALLEKP